MIRVVLVDDDHLMRAGLRMILDQTDDIDVVAEAENGQQAVERAIEEKPDVVLMDIRMPVMNGIVATKKLVRLPQAPKVVVLTTFENDEYVFDSLRAGASGFLLKRTPPDDLLAGIRTVAGDGAMLAPTVTRLLIEEFASRRTARDPRLVSELTDRETEVLQGIARGLSNDELSEELFISENTVKTHIKHVLTKLGARDRAQAVVMAFESGLMD